MKNFYTIGFTNIESETKQKLKRWNKASYTKNKEVGRAAVLESTSEFSPTSNPKLLTFLNRLKTPQLLLSLSTSAPTTLIFSI